MDLIAYREINLAQLNEIGENTLAGTLDMKVVEVGPDFLVMQMPVNSRVLQPMGLLHGGAVAALAENAGSLAAHLVAGEGKAVVGLSLNCNHLKAVREGVITATARATHIGRSTQLWTVETRNEQGELINDCRLTMAVIEKR